MRVVGTEVLTEYGKSHADSTLWLRGFSWRWASHGAVSSTCKRLIPKQITSDLLPSSISRAIAA